MRYVCKLVMSSVELKTRSMHLNDVIQIHVLLNILIIYYSFGASLAFTYKSLFIVLRNYFINVGLKLTCNAISYASIKQWFKFIFYWLTFYWSLASSDIDFDTLSLINYFKFFSSCFSESFYTFSIFIQFIK